MSAASPPSEGTQTRSSPALAPESKVFSTCSRRSARRATTRLPSGDHGGVAIERGGPGQPGRLAGAVAGPLPDVAPLRRPAHIRQPLAIGRPGRVELARALGRNLPRLAAGQVHQVEPGQCRESQVLAIGRRLGVLDQPRADRPVVHPDGEIQPRADRLRDPGRERDHPVLAGPDVDAVDLAAVGRQHGSAVRREGVARDQVAGEA